MSADRDYVVRHDHADETGWTAVLAPKGRMLREVEAKRRIIGEHEPETYSKWDCSTCVDEEDFSEDSEGNRIYHRSAKSFPCPTLLALAAVYVDHPDFDPAWLRD